MSKDSVGLCQGKCTARETGKDIGVGCHVPKYAAQVRSSPGIAVFIGEKAHPDHWLRVGRSFERFALQATAPNIRLAMINQAVEVSAVRTELATLLGIRGQRPVLVVRFGSAPPTPMSRRRLTRAAARPLMA